MTFDLRTHHYNKEGKVVRETPYRLVIDQDKGPRFERPPYSGKWYAADGTLIKDESAEVEAQKAKEAAAKEEAAKAAAAQEREKLKDELRAELAAEQAKAGTNGPRTKN